MKSEDKNLIVSVCQFQVTQPICKSHNEKQCQCDTKCQCHESITTKATKLLTSIPESVLDEKDFLPMNMLEHQMPSATCTKKRRGRTRELDKRIKLNQLVADKQGLVQCTLNTYPMQKQLWCNTLSYR